MPTAEIFAPALWVQGSLPPSLVPPSAEVYALVVTGGSSKPSRKGEESRKSKKSFHLCKYCGKMSHLAEKCWKKLGKPGWVLAVAGGKSGSAPLISVALASAAPPFGNFHIVVSPAKLAYLQASRASTMHTLPSASTSLASLARRLASYARGDASTPGTSALIASHDISLFIDSRALDHMTGTPSILTSYHLNSSIPNVHIVDGRPDGI